MAAESMARQQVEWKVAIAEQSCPACGLLSFRTACFMVAPATRKFCANQANARADVGKDPTHDKCYRRDEV